MFDVLVIGEVMAEISCNAAYKFSVGFAGDTFNTAVGTVRAKSLEPGRAVS